MMRRQQDKSGEGGHRSRESKVQRVFIVNFSIEDDFSIQFSEDQYSEYWSVSQGDTCS